MPRHFLRTFATLLQAAAPFSFNTASTLEARYDSARDRRPRRSSRTRAAAGPEELLPRTRTPERDLELMDRSAAISRRRAPHISSLRRHAEAGAIDGMPATPGPVRREPEPSSSGPSAEPGRALHAPLAADVLPGAAPGDEHWSLIGPSPHRGASDASSPPHSPGSDDSGRYETAPSSMRWPSTRWESSGRPALPANPAEAPALAQADAAGAVADPDPTASAPPTRQALLRDQLTEGLARLPFRVTDPEQRAAQKQLEARYLDRAAQIAERREKAFGSTRPYRVGSPMRTQVREGLLPAAYEGFKSFVTSSFRSPSGAVIGLSVEGEKNFFPIDRALTTSLMQGFMAYVAEGAMSAMDSRAALSNMPKVSRNNFDGLFYQQDVQPDTVLLVVKDGKKEYMRADDPRACSAAALTEQVGRKLSSIKLQQDLLDGKSFAVLASPLMSGGFNTLRRYVSSAAVLTRPLPLFVTSGLASGAASGVVKLGLEIGKTAAQVEVDDLMGGRQSVNLFRLSRPHAEAQPLRWADARRLQGFLGETFMESLALAKEASRTFVHSAADMGYRYILVNGIANVSGIGAGGLVGQLFRPGRQFGPVPGESPHSRGSIAGQMAQSTFGDALWRGLKDVMRGREMDAKASLHLRRQSRMGEQLQAARRAQEHLGAMVDCVPEASALWAAPRSAAPAPGADDLESHGNLRSRLSHAGPMDLDTLKGLRGELAALDLQGAGEAVARDRAALLRQIDRIITPLSCRAATAQWLRPRE